MINKAKKYPLKRISAQHPTFRQSGVQYLDTSNFVSEDEFITKYLADNPTLNKDCAIKMYQAYTDNDVFVSAIESVCMMSALYNYLNGDIETMLLMEYEWYDCDPLDDIRKIYFGVIKNRVLFSQMLKKHINKQAQFIIRP
jgi:hypothetical protein